MILTKNGNLMKFASGAAVNAKIFNPYDPSTIPEHTLRCRFVEGFTPTYGNTQTLIDQGQNIWDIYYKKPGNAGVLIDIFEGKNFGQNTSLIEVLGVNCTGIYSVSVANTRGLFRNCKNLVSARLYNTSGLTEIADLFYSCTSLEYVNTFDTSSCTSMKGMFAICTSLKSVPLFDTSSCTDMSNMFLHCRNVESGALALYQQASTQAVPPTTHSSCFSNCGIDTVTGAAELAQIPSDWGGTAS